MLSPAGVGGCSNELRAVTLATHPKVPGISAGSSSKAASEHEHTEPGLVVSPTFICSHLHPKPSSHQEMATRRLIYRTRTSQARDKQSHTGPGLNPGPDQRSASKKIRHSLITQSEISDRQPRGRPTPAQHGQDTAAVTVVPRCRTGSGNEAGAESLCTTPRAPHRGEEGVGPSSPSSMKIFFAFTTAEHRSCPAWSQRHGGRRGDRQGDTGNGLKAPTGEQQEEAGRLNKVKEAGRRKPATSPAVGQGTKRLPGLI